MSCSCDIRDLPSISWDSSPVARKRHVCGECGSVIDSGERYWLTKGVWDGEFSSHKMCSTCKSVYDEALYDLECICFGELWETVGVEYEAAGGMP